MAKEKNAETPEQGYEYPVRNKMYGIPVPSTTQFQIDQSYEADPIEQKVKRMLENGEPADDTAQTFYTERKDGVVPEYNIRTDNWDRALDLTNQAAKDRLTKRELRIAEQEEKKKEAARKQEPGQKDTSDNK